MRKHLRHIITLPPLTQKPNSSVRLDGTVDHDEENLILYGRVSFQNLLAEVVLTAPNNHFIQQATGNGPFWESKAWFDAYANDTALVNKLAKRSQEENFKQMTTVAVYDAQVRPGLREGKVVPEWKKFENMLETIKADAKAGMLRRSNTSSCEGKVPSDRPGTME